MKTIAPDEATEAEESDFEPLTAQQAQEWRKHQAPLSVWRLLAGRAPGGGLGGLRGRGGGGGGRGVVGGGGWGWCWRGGCLPARCCAPRQASIRGRCCWGSWVGNWPRS